MKIPKAFQKFAAPSLIIVTAKRQAQLYLAHDETLDLIDQLKVDPPHYSDREGFFGKRRGGRLVGSGSVYEHKKEKLEHEFVPEFVKHIKIAMDETKAQDVFLFLPAYQIQFILTAMPKTITSKIRTIIKQNFYGRRPVDVLKKLDDSLTKLVAKPESEEVAKLLGRPSFKPSFSV